MEVTTFNDSHVGDVGKTDLLSIRKSRTRRGILDPSCVLLPSWALALPILVLLPGLLVLTLLLLPLSLISLLVAFNHSCGGL